jgi:hypothetical protein
MLQLGRKRLNSAKAQDILIDELEAVISSFSPK